MDQQKGNKDNLDDEIAMVVLMIFSIVIIAPVILWKVAESEPEVFEHLTFKESAKGAAVALGIAFALGAALQLYPALGEHVLFHVGKLRIHFSTFGHWLAGNLVLGGLAYLTLPAWKSSVSKKKHLKDQIY